MRCARHPANHAAAQRSAYTMTTTRVPCGNSSIIDGSLCRLSIHALLMIRPLQNQRAMRGHTGSATASGDGTTLWQHRGEAPQSGMALSWRKRCTIQAKFKPILDKGESDRIKNANDLYRTNRHSMAWNHGWLPPLVDASRGRFLSMTTDEELDSRANEAQDAVMPMFTC